MRWTAIVLLIAVLATPAGARVGGGESWGGGGGGGGHDGGGELIGFLLEILIRLFIWNPSVGLLVVIGIVGVAWWTRSQQPDARFSTAAPPPQAIRSQAGTVQKRLAELDPRFSAALFLDFVQLLYVRFQNARGQASDDLHALAPYMADDLLDAARADAQKRGIQKVEDVLVGASRLVDGGGLDGSADVITLDVVFEANFTEVPGSGPLYVAEQWRFARKRGVLSKGPEDITSFACPSCGSPSELRPDGTCPYCDRVVNRGDFQWRVASITLLQSAPRPPVDLVGKGLLSGGHERGADLPTVYPPDFDASQRAFTARNTDFKWADFETRARDTFLALQQAWSNLQWERARPYETDALFNMHRYWIDMYARQGLRNHLDDISIERLEPARFGQDAFFDLITVRIWASMKDYVVNAEGTQVAGDPRNPRAFSEYWTFIRRTGSRRKADTGCPSCGAPLDVNMAGECAYCGAKITSGQFDWVLSSIEQDEACLV